LLEQRLEPVESGTPETVVVVEPRECRGERAAGQIHAVHAAIDAARHEPGGLEHAQVPRDRGRRDAMRPRQFTHERGALSEPLEHVPPHRVRQCGEDVVQWVVLIVNHIVNDIPRA
jgi:hypothetical protein